MNEGIPEDIPNFLGRSPWPTGMAFDAWEPVDSWEMDPGFRGANGKAVPG